MRLLPMAIMITSMFSSCQCKNKPSTPGAHFSFDDPLPPQFTNASVHDPSVFPVFSLNAAEFYVIGSHLAAAKTKDFMQWQQVTRDWNSRPNMFYPKDNPDPLVQTVNAQIDDVMRGAKNALGFFASDIHRMPDGRFYHYYSLTASWYCSAIGLAIADAVEGPYITQGLLVRSGEAADDSKTPDGVTGKWSQGRYPNCIDSQAFFDNDGTFWLVYGSWSGGIFLLELDPQTGMQKVGSKINTENGGYGRKLIRNNHASVEGPFIIYSPETRYYYLFVSYGGLAAGGGYNIRVFRSLNPYGPYDDAIHEDMGNNFNHSLHYQYGVKIMGGYQFKRVEGEIGEAHIGFLSPGHNSVYRDADTGKYFLIYHQRFAGRGEYHEIRVCELFLNEDGWFMAAPFRYDGSSIRTFTASNLAGTWKIINHGIDINTTPHESAAYQFMKDSTITGPDGSNRGTWELKHDGKTAAITLDGVLYKGVFLRCWDGESQRWVQGFTALSEHGVAVWGAGAVFK
jgi:arabinan endo-1,5-alpha-L-arabinosidase